MTSYMLGGTQLTQMGTAADANRIGVLVPADTTTVPADANGSNQWASFAALAQYAAQKAFGKSLVPANNFCAGDGTTDDTTGMQNAVVAALTASGLGVGGVYCPDQYRITASIVCTTANTAPGQGVSFVGADREASQIIKDFNGALLTWNGNGGPDGNPTAFGGLRDITLTTAGGTQTGPLMQVNSAQQMFFLNSSFVGNPDLTIDLNTMEDCYFEACTSNSCGSTTQPVMAIHGSSGGTSNMLWFLQTRFENFAGPAVTISRGTGATGGGNNGIFFSQCKFETAIAHSDLIIADTWTQQLSFRDCFLAADAFASGFSTPVNGIKFGDGSTGAGFNQLRLDNVFMFGSSTVRSVLSVNGTNMSGPIRIDNVVCDDTPSVGTLDLTNMTSSVVLSGDALPKVRALTDATTIAVDASFGEEFRVTLGANRTLGKPANAQDGKKIVVVVNPSTHTLSYATGINWGTAGAPTLTASKDNYLGLAFNATASEWRGLAAATGF